MSNFCHDDYDHPLLWCDGKRRLVERQDAAQAQALVRQQKDEERVRRIVEQREYRDMTLKHCPWGKPGAGAPGEQTRRGNILQQGLFPATGNDLRSYSSVQHVGKMGGRSAALTRIYSVQPSATAAAVPDHHQHINSTVPMAPHRRISKTNTSPWGRAGPGGAPWRNQKTIGQSFMKSMGWTDKHTLQQIDRDQHAPAASATSDGDQQQQPAQQHQPAATTAKPAPFLPPMQCCCSKCCCNCGMIFRDEHDTAAGGSGQQQQHVQQQQSHHRPQASRNKPTGNGGVELVPLLARRRAKQQAIALSTTDVTKLPNPSKFEDAGHLGDLCRQIRQKERREQQQRELENISSRRHFQTLDSLWGRPGHGAPRSIKNKLNLDALLYKMPMQIVDKDL